MKMDIPVPNGTLTAERVDGRHIEYTRDHGDGVQHKARMFVFTSEEIERLRACIPAAHARIRESRLRKTWHGRLRLWCERVSGCSGATAGSGSPTKEGTEPAQHATGCSEPGTPKEQQ